MTVKAQQLGPGVWLLGGRPRHLFNVYVLDDVLVDAGSRHAARRILRQTAAHALRAHALTHAHLDHMGSSHEVCEALGIPLLCGAGDVATAESGGRDDLEGKPVPVRLQHRLMAGSGHPVSRVLREGDVVGGFEVLEVPGHSPGHVAFWRRHDRLLVLGDVLFNVDVRTGRPGLSLPPAMLTPDPQANLASARRLAALGPATVCFGHGPPLLDGRRFVDFVAGAEVAQP